MLQVREALKVADAPTVEPGAQLELAPPAGVAKAEAAAAAAAAAPPAMPQPVPVPVPVATALSSGAFEGPACVFEHCLPQPFAAMKAPREELTACAATQPTSGPTAAKNTMKISLRIAYSLQCRTTY